MKKAVLTLIILVYSISYSQYDVKVNTAYRKISQNVVKENMSFNFDSTNGILTVKDFDFNTTKTYNIEYDRTTYDRGNLFNVVFKSDSVQNYLDKKGKSDNGLFAIFYDRKNGNILGVKILLLSGETNIYLTERGMNMMKQ